MEKSFKVVVFTAVYGRHEILDLWAEGVERLKHYWPEKVEITPFCIVSNIKDEEKVKEYGFAYTKTLNRPLGRKHNVGLEALKDWDFDYIMQLGSDDLATDEYLEYAIPMMQKGIDLFGVKELYFFEPKLRKACKFQLTTQQNALIGAGRFISHKAIKKLNYKLWPNSVNRGLDMTSQANLAMIGASPNVINSPEICIADVKSEVNIWSYDTFGDNYPAVDYDFAKLNFPEL